MQPRIRYGILMPGQLFEREGMGKALMGLRASSKAVRRFNDLTDGRFGRWMTEAPMEEIGVRFTAPAVMACYGCLCGEVAVSRWGPPSAVGGYSLGFYAASVCAGALDLRTVLQWMERVNGENAAAFPPGAFGLAVLTGLSRGEVEGRLEEWKIPSIKVANVNNPKQVVVAGPSRDLATAAGCFEEFVLDWKNLPLDVPLHTAYMEGTRERVRTWWSRVSLTAPCTVLLSPIDGSPIQNAETLRETVIRSLAATNDWVAVAKKLAAAELDWIVDCSPGGELGRMARWTSRELCIKPVSLLWEGVR